MAFNREYAETIHRHVVMWLNEHIGLSGNNEAIKDRFRRVTFPLYTFTDVQPAIQFIHQQQINGKSFFLIVSETLRREIVPQIYGLHCVRQILIFCGSILNHSKWAGDYVEKTLMFESDEIFSFD